MFPEIIQSGIVIVFWMLMWGFLLGDHDGNEYAFRHMNLGRGKFLALGETYFMEKQDRVRNVFQSAFSPLL